MAVLQPFCSVLLPRYVQNSILAWFLSSSFSRNSVKVKVVQLYSSPDVVRAWKNFCFILAKRCRQENFSRAMSERDGWRKRVQGIRAIDTL